LVCYLEAFGPATVQDFSRFTLLTTPVIRAAVRALGDRLVTLEGPDGQAYLDKAGAPLADEGTPAPVRLLGMWDQGLLAYADPGRLYAPGVRARVARVNGDLLPTVLVDGLVSGVWRAVEGGVEVTLFRPLGAAEAEALEGEAQALARFLGARDPGVYGRYGHWWTKGLAGAEVRVFRA